MNIQGYDSLDTVMERANKALSPSSFELLATETQALILDTRAPEVFALGFIPNSINIGLDGNFAMWVGEMITDIKQEILLITEPGREQEAMIRLSRVGYDHTIGFLDGGYQAWLSEGRETDQVARITADEFELQYTENLPTFDVRKRSEFEAEHVVNVINVPLNELNQHFASFPTDKNFILHCAGGYRSMIAASILKSRGIHNFVDVIGGMSAIAKTNVPKTAYVCPSTLL
jgi:rhodanese-related sulfurtransferase